MSTESKSSVVDILMWLVIGTLGIGAMLGIVSILISGIIRGGWPALLGIGFTIAAVLLAFILFARHSDSEEKEHRINRTPANEISESSEKRLSSVGENEGKKKE